MNYRKLYIRAFFAFVFCLLMSMQGNNGSSSRHNFFLGYGTYVTCADDNSTANSFSGNENAAQRYTLLSESREIFSDNNNSFELGNEENLVEDFSLSLFSYIRHYSNNRVLHPPLEALGMWLI